MTFPIDWDIDKYRVEHECDEHWELRRRFLETHKDKYPEDRLVCLAQVFYNVEFMGCRYPEKTMRLVAQLSEGVADDHRDKMKSKLQRTFVQASDAASSKVKGRSGNEDTAQKKPKSASISFQKSSEEYQNQSRNNLNNFNLPSTTSSTVNPRSKSSPTSSSQNNIPGRFVLADQSSFEDPIRLNKKRPLNEAEPQRLVFKKIRRIEDLSSRLVIMESQNMNAYGILSRSTGAARMILKQEKVKANSGSEVILSIDGVVLAQAKGPSIDAAKKICAEESLGKLKKLCYTLVIKDRFAGSVVDKTDISDSKGKVSQNAAPDHLAEDSKANRMMKLMGWAGGGLGKNQQGRQEPVQAVEHVKRAGLGQQIEGGPVFKNNMNDLLLKYRSRDYKHDLVFASDFSKEERKIIHNMASKLGLKSVSYGKDADRQLVVSKKKTPLEIVEEVKEAGGSTDKYDLIPPEQN